MLFACRGLMAPRRVSLRWPGRGGMYPLIRISRERVAEVGGTRAPPDRPNKRPNKLVISTLFLYSHRLMEQRKAAKKAKLESVERIEPARLADVSEAISDIVAEFTLWFLRACLDQVSFMSSLFELETLARRLRTFVERSETLKPEA